VRTLAAATDPADVNATRVRVSSGRRWPSTLVAAAALAFVFVAPPSPAELEEDVFARVGEVVITTTEYEMALREQARRRFYHGRPADAELASFRREVGEGLIADALVVQEAQRRGLEVDESAVETELSRTQQQARQRGGRVDTADPFWRAVRERIARAQLVGAMREQLRDGLEPSEGELRTYYDRNPEKFTEPERMRLSLILLKVDPSAPPESWDAARREGQDLVRRLRSGSSFPELARLHSADPSSARGGDMGYLHRGMLGEPVQQVLDALGPGDVSEPLQVLEGIAVFRLEDRQPERRSAYAEVLPRRVADLWRREAQDRAWDALISRLRAQTPIEVRDAPPEPAAAGPPGI
jgi:parvulin-like peptidyl-prolyl isomerase